MKLRKGFTLIELLVVVAIIGVLATIVLGSLSDARARARDARRHADIRAIQNQLEIYYLDNGQYPIRTWQYSYNSSWDSFQSIIGAELPKDPVNESLTSTSGGLSYAYRSNSTTYTNCPLGEWYVLVYSLEGTVTDEQNIGVTRCDTGTQRRWANNSITVGRSSAQ